MARVLIVDDEEAMRDAVRIVLEGEGHAVQQASSGDMALEMLRAAAFDAVLLDIQMPGLDGLQTLSKIREKTKTLPVIMVTGYGSVDSAVRVMEMGASQYLSKPFKNQALLEALRKVLPAPIMKIVPPLPPPSSVAPAVTVNANAPALKLPDLEIVSASPKRSGLGVFVVVLMAFAAAGFGAWHFLQAPQGKAIRAPSVPARIDNFALPYQNPSSLLWQGDKLWVLDWYSQSIYVHELKGSELNIVHVYHLSSKHVTGFALAGDALYTCDSWTRRIEKHKLDEFLTVEGSAPAPGKSPASLFWDGKYLWCSDAQEAKIYQLEPAAQRLVKIAAYDAPAKATSGFYKDANFAWTADMQTRKIYEHRLDNRLTVIATYTNEDFERGPEPLSTFCWVGNDLWFARDRQPTIHRRTKAQLKRTDILTPIN